MNPVLEAFRGKLIVSCQANPDSPLRDSYVISRMSLAAVKGGAAAGAATWAAPRPPFR